MRKLLLVAVACGVLGLLAGCNTIKGMGEDIKSAGETIEGAAKKK